MLGNLWQIVFGDIGLKQDFADRHITQKLIHFITGRSLFGAFKSLISCMTLSVNQWFLEAGVIFTKFHDWRFAKQTAVVVGQRHYPSPLKLGHYF